MPVPIRIFLDTEIPTAEDPRLISPGLASEQSDDHLYVVLTQGWTKEDCSDFVRNEILPLLDARDPDYLTPAGAAARIEEWLDKQRNGDRGVQVKLVCDHPDDWHLLQRLFTGEPGWAAQFNAAMLLAQEGVLLEDDLGGRNPARVRRLFAAKGEFIERHGGRHHALADALALRFAWGEAWLA